MKYLIAWINQGKLYWDICKTKEEAISRINVNLGDKIIRDRITDLSNIVLFVEIESNYEVLNLEVQLPTLLNIKAKRLDNWK